MSSLYRNYDIIKILFLTVRWSFIFVYVRITLFNGHINLQKTMQIFENVGIHNHMIQQNRSVGVIIYKTKMSLSKHSHQGSRVPVEKKNICKSQKWQMTPRRKKKRDRDIESQLLATNQPSSDWEDLECIQGLGILQGLGPHNES